MLSRSVQLVLHQDGAGFPGWQRQPDERTVQGELEAAVSRLCGTPIAIVGAGRTDAGVHARGQAAFAETAYQHVPLPVLPSEFRAREDSRYRAPRKAVDRWRTLHPVRKAAGFLD